MKEIKITRPTPSSPWDYQFGDNVGIKDVRLVAQRLLLSYLRFKRRKRLASKIAQRKEAAKPQKEAVNGTA